MDLGAYESVPCPPPPPTKLRGDALVVEASMEDGNRLNLIVVDDCWPSYCELALWPFISTAGATSAYLVTLVVEHHFAPTYLLLRLTRERG